MIAVLLAVPALLQLSGTGGPSGRGNGQATISSAYEIDVLGADGKHCARPLSVPQREALGGVLHKAAPGQWKKKYGKVRDDPFTFTLVYLRGKRSQRVQWTDAAVESLPIDLGIIVREVEEMRASALEACGVAPAGQRR